MEEIFFFFPSVDWQSTGKQDKFWTLSDPTTDIFFCVLGRTDAALSGKSPLETVFSTINYFSQILPVLGTWAKD